MLKSSFVVSFEFKRFDKTIPVEFDVAALPDSTIAYLLRYGAKQSLADSFAAAENAAEFEASLANRAKTFMDGTAGERTRIGDVFESTCLKIARERFNAAAKAKGIVISKLDPKVVKARVQELRKKTAESVEAEARRRLESVEVEEDETDDILGDLAGPIPKGSHVVFQITEVSEDFDETGWYWQDASSGTEPDANNAFGPFESEEAAHEDAGKTEDAE